MFDALTPREIVAELDRHVVGQAAAKRAVAIALRNRIRRQRLPPELSVEVTPKNILMIGPTGVGKTEIARRLAQLSGSPFVKVEASKFTEVGYVGRDVDSMIRDLTEVSVGMVRREKRQEVAEKAERLVEDRLLDLLLPMPRASSAPSPGEGVASENEQERFLATREKLRHQLRSGDLDGRTVEVEVHERHFPSLQILSSQGVEEMDVNLREMMPGLFGGKAKKRLVPVPEARQVLLQQEEERLIDHEQAARIAIERVQSSGIVFIDEIDKVAGREAGHGPEVSREGVQRDMLPIVEGTTVTTKYGPVRTDHILFIAAGAFHVSKPSDLIPELQGRFPIRVELQSLSLSDLVRILTEPQSALLTQCHALLATEGIDLALTDEAVHEVARFAMDVNEASENIGARRLSTVIETVLDEISFEAPDRAPARVLIDADEVRRKLTPLVENRDLGRFIL